MSNPQHPPSRPDDDDFRARRDAGTEAQRARDAATRKADKDREHATHLLEAGRPRRAGTRHEIRPDVHQPPPAVDASDATAEAPEQVLERLRAESVQRLDRGELSYSSAIDLLATLGQRCSDLHAAAKRTVDVGDYRAAVEIALRITKRFSFPKLPDSPAGGVAVSLGVAYEFVSACRQLFMDRAQPEYWQWRYSTSTKHDENGFVEWHLDNMSNSWRVELAHLPQQARVIETLTRMRTEFEYLHRLWANPHRSPDYLCVAMEAHKLAADVLPLRPPVPEGRHAFAQLARYLTELERAIVGHAEPTSSSALGLTASREVRLVEEERDPHGFVVTPKDRTAYLPAIEIMANYPTLAKSMKVLHSILHKNLWIRRWKPSAQRLSVHAVDFQRYADQLGNRTTDADGVLEVSAEIDARKAVVRAASKPRPRARGKLGSNFPPTSLPGENR